MSIEIEAATAETTVALERFNLGDALLAVMRVGASDLHLKAGNVPLVRIDGHLRPLAADIQELIPAETEQSLHDMLPAAKMQQFETDHEIDFSYGVHGVGRFRVNAYMQRGTVAIVLRAIPFALHTVAQLGLPDVVRRLADEERGIVFVTGTTGSGKSTTLAAMIGHINHTMCKKVITIEDPIEYLHADASSSVDQREVGSDTASFGRALRRVLRQDPDVILVGEIRDEESARAALAAAETGHLVLTTLHTLDAPETVNRMIDFFPPHEHRHIRAVLADTLKGVVAQRLSPAANGRGRVAVCEVLTMTGRVHDMILDEAKTEDLPDAIAEGEYYGMQTFDQALLAAVRSGAILLEDAMRLASHPQDLKLMLLTTAPGADDDASPSTAPPSR